VAAQQSAAPRSAAYSANDVPAGASLAPSVDDNTTMEFAFAARDSNTTIDFAFAAHDIAFATRDGKDKAAATAAQLKYRYLRGSDLWMQDGGATCHIKQTTAGLINIRPANIQVETGGGVLVCTQVGDYVADFPLPNNTTRRMMLRNVRVLPSMGLNIISERPFIKGGCSVLKSGAYSDTVSSKGEGVPLYRSTACPDTELFYTLATQPWSSTTASARLAHAYATTELKVKDTASSLDSRIFQIGGCLLGIFTMFRVFRGFLRVLAF